MSKIFSTLIVGCGNIAGGYDAGDISGPNILTHAKAFRIHAGFELAGCIDSIPDIAREFADIWQLDRAYESLDQALEEGEFDVISVCVSTPNHEKILRRLWPYEPALVFCEKPLTDRIETAGDMAALYQGKMAVNYLRRFDPEIRRLGEQIAAGKYGRFLAATARYNKGLYNNGSHMTDLLDMLTGPMTVIEAGTVTDDFWPDDPTISARLESGNGARIELIGSDMRRGMIFDLELVFDQARIYLTDFSHSLTIQPNGGETKKITTGLDQAMLNGVSNIYDHLTVGAELFSGVDNALRALEICSEIRKQAGV